MKGPGMRLDLDVRRLWRCPSCGAERRTSGDRTVLRCAACSDHPLMALIEGARPVRPAAQPLDLTIELHPDDVDAPPALPAGMTTEPATGESRQQSAPERVTPPPRPKQSRPERQKRSSKRKNRRRSRKDTNKDTESSPSAGASSPPATSPAAAASSATTAADPNVAEPAAPEPTVSKSSVSKPSATEPRALEPGQSTPAAAGEPEAFGEGVLDG